MGGFATNGEELEEVYAKLEKAATILWKKQVGMIVKKEVNPHEQKKKKKGKSKKHLLTSMTYHFPNKTQETQEEEEPPEEEPPEDGFGEHLEAIRETTAEEMNHSPRENQSPRSENEQETKGGQDL